MSNLECISSQSCQHRPYINTISHHAPGLVAWIFACVTSGKWWCITIVWTSLVLHECVYVWRSVLKCSTWLIETPVYLCVCLCVTSYCFACIYFYITYIYICCENSKIEVIFTFYVDFFSHQGLMASSASSVRSKNRYRLNPKWQSSLSSISNDILSSSFSRCSFTVFLNYYHLVVSVGWCL